MTGTRVPLQRPVANRPQSPAPKANMHDPNRLRSSREAAVARTAGAGVGVLLPPVAKRVVTSVCPATCVVARASAARATAPPWGALRRRCGKGEGAGRAKGAAGGRAAPSAGKPGGAARRLERG
eukprot:CAMPEP_0206224502 /NCGR_PEP_ID=MMETSP0047_2-20121206/7059_1 /ASSEMBLY_ACC=CAM_ASM_000192 /TAXON_ID=195065 /ORGANISM="Chroomonas mesostigmatica_cf, Strain CCMP1168" /LENGTH=123 /DNA_ID=CAMNT_0053647461 /DNA_START=407 /DNA_END=774 /DNA_ORIENTATION=+